MKALFFIVFVVVVAASLQYGLIPDSVERYIANTYRGRVKKIEALQIDRIRHY